MKISTRKIAICMTMLATLALSSNMYAQSERDGIEAETTAVSIAVRGNNVRISGASGHTLEIYNLTGVKVESVEIDSNDKSITLNLQKGCYILKVGGVVRKISIK